ncbi:hypothetical protein GCM10010344_24800 [Streptomyces bluensis]|nr:hypothetical protein GCM10010344_24800 [Streptomyces bluensis]
MRTRTQARPPIKQANRSKRVKQVKADSRAKLRRTPGLGPRAR